MEHLTKLPAKFPPESLVLLEFNAYYLTSSWPLDLYQVRFAPLMNPVALTPACEPGLPDLFHLQTRSACPEVFTRNERCSPGPQVGTGRPLGMRRECVVNTSALRRNPAPVSFPAPPGTGSPQPSGLPSQASEAHGFVGSIPVSLFLTVHMFVCKRCSLSPTGFSRLLPSPSFIRGAVPTVTVTTDTLITYTCVLVVQWAGSFKRIPRQAAKCWWTEQWSQMGPKSDYAPKEPLEGSSGEK